MRHGMNTIFGAIVCITLATGLTTRIACARADEVARLDGQDFPKEQATADLLGLQAYIGRKSGLLDERSLSMSDILTIGRVIGLVETHALLRTGRIDPIVARSFGGESGVRAAIMAILPPPPEQAPTLPSKR